MLGNNPAIPARLRYSRAGSAGDAIMAIDEDRRPKALGAIKAHGSALNHDMKGPDASNIRKEAANTLVARDQAASNRARGDRYNSGKEKSPLVTSRDVTRAEGATKGKLSAEMNKAKGREFER